MENGSPEQITGSQPVTSYYVYVAAGNSMAIYTGTTLTEMPFYGSDRLGTYNVSGNSYAYELKDNVGSIRAVINRNKNATGQADIQTYTDYYPFGSIARRDGTTYRYDYQGAYAEKDNITNWNNFELRMYDSRIGRWLGPDPKGQFASPYEGMGNNPVNGFDPTGGYDSKTEAAIAWLGSFLAGQDPSAIYNSGGQSGWGYNVTSDELGARSNFGRPDAQPSFGSSVTNRLYDPLSVQIHQNDFYRSVTESFSGKIFGKEGRLFNSNVTLSNKGMDGADVSIWKLGFGYDGAGSVEGVNTSLVIGKTTYSLGVTATGAFSYTTFVRHDDQINGTVTTFTPKLGSSVIALSKIVHNVIEGAANELHNTTNSNHPPLIGPAPMRIPAF